MSSKLLVLLVEGYLEAIESISLTSSGVQQETWFIMASVCSKGKQWMTTLGSALLTSAWRERSPAEVSAALIL